MPPIPESEFSGFLRESGFFYPEQRENLKMAGICGRSPVRFWQFAAELYNEQVNEKAEA